MRDLIGAPYALPCDPPHTFDCWQLVVHARETIGLRTPHGPVAVEDRSLADKEYFAHPDPKVWTPIGRPSEGCVVAFGNPASHVGVYIGGRVLHASHKTGVCLHALEAMERFFGSPRYWEVKHNV